MVAVDVILFTVVEGTLHTLVIEMKKDPFCGKLAFPGGLVQGGESIEDAAHRHLKEKTGVSSAYLEQLYTFGNVDRDPFGRVVSVSYIGLIRPDVDSLNTTRDYGQVAWIPVNDLDEMAYDHDAMRVLALSRLRAKMGYTNIAFGLMPEKFTLSELQQTYENILGKHIDKRNFRRKILSLGILTSTGKRQMDVSNRPALLYTFTHKRLVEADILA